MAEINQLNVDNTVYDIRDSRNDWIELSTELSEDKHSMLVNLNDIPACNWDKRAHIILRIAKAGLISVDDVYFWIPTRNQSESRFNLKCLTNTYITYNHDTGKLTVKDKGSNNYTIDAYSARYRFETI